MTGHQWKFIARFMIIVISTLILKEKWPVLYAEELRKELQNSI